MPPELPPELAALVDFAERPRVDYWSLRSALVRYAQPEPQRVSDLLDVVRRVEWALAKKPNLDGLLAITRELDALGDELAAWAVDITQPQPDADVDRVVADVATRLDQIGVPQQERPPGPRNRG